MNVITGDRTDEATAVSRDLHKFLDELDAQRPKSDVGRALLVRRAGDAPTDDTPPQGTDWLEEDGDIAADSPTPAARKFRDAVVGSVVAVDCGLARLGEFEDGRGLVIALRAAIVIDDPTGCTVVKTLRSGPLRVRYDQDGQITLFHRLGQQLGQPDYYVEIDDSRPIRVRRGVAERADLIADRLRNWWERKAQKVAVSAVQGGTILFDGALTLRSRDTPDKFLRGLVRDARAHGNSVVAVSKKSELQIQGRSIRVWLCDWPERAGIRPLSPILRNGGDGRRASRVLGEVYVARFSPLGQTFRVDVAHAPTTTPLGALDQFYASVLMRAGYPDILVRAHVHSWFAPSHLACLQADACARFGLAPKPESSLSGAFAPFGGRFK